MESKGSRKTPPSTKEIKVSKIGSKMSESPQEKLEEKELKSAKSSAPELKEKKTPKSLTKSKSSSIDDKDNESELFEQRENITEQLYWKIFQKYRRDNPYYLVAHHLDSYNDFFSRGIFQIFRENNPIRFMARKATKDTKDDEETVIESEKKNQCFLYLGGKNGTKLYFGKPVIYDDNIVSEIIIEEDEKEQKEGKEGKERKIQMAKEFSTGTFAHYMYPNDARLRSMTYGLTIHYDVDVDFIYYNAAGEKIEHSITLEKIYLGRFPIMLHSNLCILKGMTPAERYNAGECKNDYGGYFIINGKEKSIISQEKFADNMLYVRKYKEDTSLYSYSCEVRSVSEDSSKPIRYTSVKIVAPDSKRTNNQIVVDVPNVRKPVPIFILMRALGIISDKDIIETCLLDLETNREMVDLFIPSIHDASRIFSQQVALKFIASFTKRKTVSSALEILMNYFLPHVGEDNYLEKAYYIGHMVNKLLKVYIGREKETDRDNFKFKRVEVSGTLIYDLFREYYLIQKRDISLKIDNEFYWHIATYLGGNFPKLIEDNYREFFKERLIENGFRRGFKGNWGADPNTKRVGLVQDLNRLSWFTFISQLRKINLPLDPTAKVVGPHWLHSSQWGVIDPVDTPDGGNIGLHKHMAITTIITSGYSATPMIRWLRANTPLRLLGECNRQTLSQWTSVFVNGNWIGVLENPIEAINILKMFRRNGIFPIYTSLTFHYQDNAIYIYTDSGRLTRPIYYKTATPKFSIDIPRIHSLIDSGDYSWLQLVSGFQEKKEAAEYTIRSNRIYDDVKQLYAIDGAGAGADAGFENLLKFFEKNQGIIDYIDTSEEENALIMTQQNLQHNNTGNKSSYYTHMEMHPSIIFGVMGNCITYPEANQLPRNVFSCGQSRQAVSLYHSNYMRRLDKMGVVLQYGQIPLIKTRYLEYINNEEQPYGVNTIVAIMSYTGYNVEDAILINEASIQRGLFRTTYFSTYEAHEESSKVAGSNVNSFFTNIENKQNIRGLKEGYDYSWLDESGLVREGTKIDERIVLVGQLTSQSNVPNVYIDHSTTTKKGQLGVVDKSFISEGEEGFRIAKIRIYEDRLPAIGDKMASRCGQKGTIGLIIPEVNMPFTADGVRPDLIINPHAIPSRMTIGQLIETLFGKACVIDGAFGDCTAFVQKGSNYATYGEMLASRGFSNTGNQILYSGFTGEPLHSDIFIGPTYYMRLKHMVKDKINYRATGKRNVLTRQTNQGRANDGGLRIGEMERDAILAHGMSAFLNDSFLVRGDEYYMAVCNKSGAIAIYNPTINLFLSPFADGPLKFKTNLEGQQVLDVFSRYGRSFSILRIPYSLKLLIQELQVMNVQMRIITEDNIDQLMNLSYQSQNLAKLLKVKGKKINIEQLVSDYRPNMLRKLETGKSGTTMNIPRETTPTAAPIAAVPEIKEESPEFAPGSAQGSSPEFAPGSAQGSSPEFAPGSPEFAPGSAQGSSPEFAPGSAQEINMPISEMKSSPEYAPTSPGMKGGNSQQQLLFTNTIYNQVFSKLSPEKQAIIRELDPRQQQIVIKQILEEANRLRNTNGRQDPESLASLFKVLPVNEKLHMLDTAYNPDIAVAEEKNAANTTDDSWIVVDNSANVFNEGTNILKPSTDIKITKLEHS